MRRSWEVIAAVVLCLGCVHHSLASPDMPTDQRDTAEIYRTFLDSWTGKDKAPISVAARTTAISAEDLKQFSGCVTHDGVAASRWVPTEPTDDLTNSVGTLTYVRLVDPDKWKPRDPGELMVQGQSVESAVESGFAHGLLTFSAIAFDESHETAAFMYSFACGALCGNGSTVIFRKSPGGWIQSNERCGGWLA